MTPHRWNVPLLQILAQFARHPNHGMQGSVITESWVTMDGDFLPGIADTRGDPCEGIPKFTLSSSGIWLFCALGHSILLPKDDREALHLGHPDDLQRFVHGFLDPQAAWDAEVSRWYTHWQTCIYKDSKDHAYFRMTWSPRPTLMCRVLCPCHTVVATLDAHVAMIVIHDRIFRNGDLSEFALEIYDFLWRIRDQFPFRSPVIPTVWDAILADDD